ncbi:MAG: AraC family transcriptional regulator [Defluviitaleaceae bacterium]|nr:AraC family transcriptional regulator [Defluviitaleaceae bacterium]
MDIRKKPVLLRYISVACILTLILAMSFTINNILFLNNLRRSFDARVSIMVENAITYMEDRIAMYASTTTLIASHNDVRQLSRSDLNDNVFIRRSDSVRNTLLNIRAINTEISDILVVFDDLPVSLTADGTWSTSYLSPHWEALSGVNICLLQMDIRTSFSSQGDHIISYNNIHRGIHVFLKADRSSLESIFAQLVPESYGRFTVVATDGKWMLSNNANFPYGNASIIVDNVSGRIYSFYPNPQMYHAITSNMMLISFGIMGGIMIIAVFLLYLIKKALYDPLPNIIKSLYDGDIKNPESQNEFSQIIGAIDQMHISLSQLEKSQRLLDFNQLITAEVTDEIKARIDLGSKMYAALTILFEDENGNKDSSMIHAFSKAAGVFDVHQVYGISKFSLFYFFLDDEIEYTKLVTWTESYMKWQSCYTQCGISELHSGYNKITQALDESLMAFLEMPLIALTPERKPALWTQRQEQISGCKISALYHNQLISAVMEGDMEKIETAIFRCIDINKAVDALDARRLILYLYDTVCLIVSQGDVINRRFLENVYNPNLLISLVLNEISKGITSDSPDQKISSWVDKNLHRDISLTELAEAMDISYSYASKFFTNTTGVNFVEYLQKHRTQRAMVLLRETDKPIDKIASETGFASLNTFFRVFKKNVGMTPGKYREANRE